MSRIRPLALALIARAPGEWLLTLGRDPVDGRDYLRPPGGAIEFGERSADAAAREMMEEFGLALRDIRPAGTLENLFTYAGAPGHEIVLLHTAAFADPAAYRRDELVGVESDGQPLIARWYDAAAMAATGWPVFPDGIEPLLRRLAAGAPPPA
ncbi:MAG TPA: NUDIX domain-containing protein [Alphaproteobacteria bacterium]|nr:NUDIX domain-containing protein [Alphaproteobacteria bacterium]